MAIQITPNISMPKTVFCLVTFPSLQLCSHKAGTLFRTYKMYHIYISKSVN